MNAILSVAAHDRAARVGARGVDHDVFRAAVLRRDRRAREEATREKPHK